MRGGTRTELKRRWKPKGHRPICSVKIGYKFVYLHAALNPYDGQLIALLLPFITKECFRIFMGYFEEQTQMVYGDGKILMIFDRASNHQSDVINSKTIFLEKLPPACPELNPAERFFKQLIPISITHVICDRSISYRLPRHRSALYEFHFIKHDIGC